jgi:hypothetical protein
MDRTVGPREALAAGIISLGVLAIIVPLIADRIPDVADPAGLIAAMSVLLGIFVIVAGLASLRTKD